jgi:hypothetical protein
MVPNRLNSFSVNAACCLIGSLVHVDLSRAMSLNEIHKVIQASRHGFENLLANPAHFEESNPTLTCEEIMEFLESLFLLEPLEEKWGLCGTWKCMCEDFMSGALCDQSDDGAPV